MMSSYSGAKHPPASLQEFLREQLPPEGKAQRVSLALAALNEEEKIKLSSMHRKVRAGNADLEETT